MNMYLGFVLVVLAFCFWFFWLRHFRMGVGMMMEWQNGKVIVVSRLIKSPAGRAGIKKGHQILEINYMPMNFDSGKEWLEWNKRHPSILSGIGGHRHRKALIRVGIGSSMNEDERDGCDVPSSKTSFEVELIPELIDTRIPYHPAPRKLSEDECALITESVHFCPKTGTQYTKQRLSSTALKNAFPY